MVNTLLDIGYTILFSYMDAVASIFGFDCYNGVLHRQFYMRKSLICDLVEPFRVLIDKTVYKGINLCQFKEEDFAVYNDVWYLRYEKSAEYSGIFIKTILEKKEEVFIYVRDVYRCFMKNEMDDKFPVWEYK